jgi:small-conductance mechanosensitive channel
MKKLLLFTIFFGSLLGFLPNALYSDETVQIEETAKICQPTNLIIDPLCLPVDISNYFAENKIDVIKSQKEIIEALNASILSWAPKEKGEAEALIKQIDSNLNFYVKNISAPPKAPSETYSRLPEYTLSEIIRIYHLTQQSSNSLVVLKETLKKIENQISDTQILKGQLRKEYVKLELSPQKGILGLKILFYWTNVLSYEVQKSQEQIQIQRESDNLKILDEILDEATENLIGSPESLKEITLKAQDAEIVWKKSQENLQKYNLSFLRNKIENTVDEKYRSQELISLEIDESFNHLDYVSLLIKESLETLLISPSKSNYEEDNNHLYEWNKLLTNYESKINKWTENTLTQFQRSIEEISIAEEETSEKKKEVYKRLTKLTQANQVLLQKLQAEIKDARFLLTLFKNNLATVHGGPAALEHKFITTVNAIADEIHDLSAIPLFILAGITITPLDIFKIFIIILATMWFSRFILAALTHYSTIRTGVKKSLIYRIHRLIHYALMTIGLFLALSVIGFDFSKFIIVAGALGVGIGFGLQSIANNFISGIIILFESYLKIGDIIELQSGQKGEILEINFRSTTIRTFDGTDLLIPNSELINKEVTNWTLGDFYRRIHVPFSTAYGTDKEFVAKLIEEGAKTHSITICRPIKSDPKVSLVKLGDSGLEFELVVWVEARVAARTLTALSDYLWMIQSLFEENNIEVPFPQRDIRIIPNKEASV